MALEVSQSVCIRCGDFHVTETTGLYNDPDNLTGYGDPNPAFGDTAPYTVSFIKPKEAESFFTLDLLADPPTPDIDGHYEYLVTSEQLGYDGDPMSGVWYLVVLHGTETKRIAYLATGEIEHRIRKCVCCDNLKYMTLFDDLQGAIRLFKCFKNREAQEVIDELYRKTAECCDCGC